MTSKKIPVKTFEMVSEAYQEANTFVFIFRNPPDFREESNRIRMTDFLSAIQSHKWYKVIYLIINIC